MTQTVQMVNAYRGFRLMVITYHSTQACSTQSEQAHQAIELSHGQFAAINLT